MIHPKIKSLSRSKSVNPDDLDCLSFYNNILQTGWLINNQNLVLTVMTAGDPRSGCLHSQVLVKALFQNWTIDDREILGRGMWIEFSEWSNNMKIFMFHVNAQQRMTSAEENFNNKVDI